MPNDELRRTIEEAYDKDTDETSEESTGHDDSQSLGDDAGGIGGSEPGGEGETGTIEKSEDSSSVEEDTIDTETPAEEDSDGGAKFLPPEGEQTAGQETDIVSSDTVAEKVPVAWRGAAKQHWGDLPAEVRQEVIRREREVDKVLHGSADARKFQQEFEQTVKPFEGFMAADGVSPLQATQNLMRTAATLQVGNPQQKAAVAFDIIKRYGVDIEMLDSMLAGETPSQASPMAGNGGGVPSSAMQYIDQRLAPVNQFIQGLQGAQQQRQETLNKEVDDEFDTFAADPENIFLEDVRDVMADLLQAAAQNGRKMSFKQAYDLAVGMDPEKARIQTQRAGARNAAARRKTLAQKKAAAASVQGTPVTPSPATPSDLRGQIRAAWDLHRGGT